MLSNPVFVRGALLAPMFALLSAASVTLVQDPPAQPAPAPAAAAPAPREIPAELAPLVEQATRLGRELFGNDRASSRATDALAAKLGSLEDRGIGGYFAVHESDDAGKPVPSWIVYFTSDEAPPRVLHRVRVALEARAPEVLDTPEPLPLAAELAPLAAARERAIEAGAPYEQSVNPVVLRGRDAGVEGLRVYLLAATDQPGIAVLGRHVCVELSADGTRVVQVRPLSKGVIEIPLATPANERVHALSVTHVLGDTPSEAHVFASLAYGLPIFVGTARGLWKVEAGTVQYFGTPPAPKSRLSLALRERDGGAPRAGRILLWRVEIPVEPPWGAGDQYVGDYAVPASGLVLPDLVPGRYRVLCDAQALSAGELAPFEVRGATSEIVLDVDPPREREAWVDLVDARGEPFETAELTLSTRSGGMRTPEWRHPRAPLDPEGEYPAQGVGGGMSSTTYDRPPRKVRRGAHGFSLGPELEDGGLYLTSRSFSLRVYDHGTVHGAVPCDGRVEPRFRMLLVEKGSLEGVFQLPGGEPVDLERVRLSTPLEPDREPRPAEWWLDVPIDITVNVPGYEPLRLEHRLRKGKLAPQVLKPRG